MPRTPSKKDPGFKTRPGEVRRRDVAARLAGEKLTKELANYRVGKGQKVCLECEYYENPESDTSPCSRVVGSVDANNVCDLFKDQKHGKPGALSRGAATIEVTINT